MIKQIFVYDKVEKKSFSNSISSIASGRNFYTNSSNQSIENEIGVLESKAGAVFNELIESLNSNRFSKITEEQKNILIEFIWLQMSRTLESRINFGIAPSHICNKIADIPFELDVKDVLNQKWVKDEHIDFLRSFKENPFALELLGSKNFIIVENKTQIDFFTSDEAVVRHLHNDIVPSVYEVFLPITSKFGIWIIPKKINKQFDAFDGKLYQLIEEESILFYNSLQIYWSTRQIFSLTGNFGQVNKILEQNPKYGNLNKKRVN